MPSRAPVRATAQHMQPSHVVLQASTVTHTGQCMQYGESGQGMLHRYRSLTACECHGWDAS